MILSIVKFGAPILRRHNTWADLAAPGFQNLIADMWETMYDANGCGLAAPQVNHSIRLFIVDSIPTYLQMEEADRKIYFEGDQGIREAFVNPLMIQKSERTWKDEEGCLSIPGVSLRISRPWSITIRYSDAQFREHTRVFSGMTARMIQHEYDHIEGKLFLDYLDAGKRLLLKTKLNRIKAGK
ncbi:peptide deformylase [Dyadobacter sp. SG02]|nr:peptide deformylase [Dyadobacter sp. SG02]